MKIEQQTVIEYLSSKGDSDLVERINPTFFSVKGRYDEWHALDDLVQEIQLSYLNKLSPELSSSVFNRIFTQMPDMNTTILLILHSVQFDPSK